MSSPFDIPILGLGMLKFEVRRFENIVDIQKERFSLLVGGSLYQNQNTNIDCELF